MAARLNKEWARDPTCRVTQTTYVAELKKRGFSEAEIGTHAGLADTALTLAIDPKLVRPEAMAQAGAAGAHNGVTGDPCGAARTLISFLPPGKSMSSTPSTYLLMGLGLSLVVAARRSRQAA